jgi:diketogulonate reductase-like aldo/keto reductase
MEFKGLQTVNMPVLGLGSWQSAPGEVEQAIEWALEEGYRHFDTAYMYRNEAEIGKVLTRWISEGKVDRKDLFITTKLPMFGMRPEHVEDFCNQSLKSLGLDYLDLFLIHSPIGIKRNEEGSWFAVDKEGCVTYEKDTDHVAIWRVMESLVYQGKAKSIGVSNWNSRQVEKVSEVAKIPIATNQVELHAYHQQKPLVETCHRLGIKMTCYAPLGSPGRASGGANILEDSTVVSIAKHHNKTPAQVLLRHLIQCGYIVIPKSIKQHRLKENLSVFDFSLNNNEMSRMNLLDKGVPTFTGAFLKGDMNPKDLPEYPRDIL